MALKLNLTRASQEDIELAREGRGQRYNGPTPPPDVYNVELKKLAHKTTKNGKDAFNALFEIKETGDKEVYNGAGIFNLFLFPSDPSERAYQPQLDQIMNFLEGISNGKLTWNKFVDLANEGKIITSEETKLGEEISQIGSFKVAKAQPLTVKVEHDEWQGKTQVRLAYIINDAPDAGSKVEEDPDDDIDLDDWIDEDD